MNRLVNPHRYSAAVLSQNIYGPYAVSISVRDRKTSNTAVLSTFTEIST